MPPSLRDFEEKNRYVDASILVQLVAFHAESSIGRHKTVGRGRGKSGYFRLVSGTLEVLRPNVWGESQASLNLPQGLLP